MDVAELEVALESLGASATSAGEAIRKVCGSGR
jgi:hypothetical protein